MLALATQSPVVEQAPLQRSLGSTAAPYLKEQIDLFAGLAETAASLNSTLISSHQQLLRKENKLQELPGTPRYVFSTISPRDWFFLDASQKLRTFVTAAQEVKRTTQSFLEGLSLEGYDLHQNTAKFVDNQVRFLDRCDLLLSLVSRASTMEGYGLGKSVVKDSPQARSAIDSASKSVRNLIVSLEELKISAAHSGNEREITSAFSKVKNGYQLMYAAIADVAEAILVAKSGDLDKIFAECQKESVPRLCLDQKMKGEPQLIRDWIEADYSGREDIISLISKLRKAGSGTR